MKTANCSLSRDVVFLLVAASLLILPGCGKRDTAGAAEPSKVEVRGSVIAPQRSVVVAPFDGRVGSIAVREGSVVRAGDLLVTMINPSLERDLAYAKAQRTLAEYRLNNNRAPAASSKSDNAYANERAKATADLLRNRKDRLDRVRKLYQTRDVAKSELEEAEAAYSMAQRESAVERQARGATASAAQTTYDPELLKLELERTKAEEEIVLERRNLLNVTAPISGVVTHIDAVAGTNMFARQTLLDISNNSTIDVRAQIAPELTQYFRAGLPVEVKIFTVPPRRFVQPIKSVVPPGSTDGPAIIISIPNKDSLMQVGTPAVITLRL